MISVVVKLLHGLDSLTAEHLHYSHSIISTLLAKLFNFVMLCHYVPIGFGLSNTVPIPKVKDYRSKAQHVTTSGA